MENIESIMYGDVTDIVCLDAELRNEFGFGWNWSYIHAPSTPSAAHMLLVKYSK